MKRKQVVFEYVDSELLNHALSKDNFSDYVKALIKTDIVNKVLEKKEVKPNIYEIYNNKTKPLLKVKKL